MISTTDCRYKDSGKFASYLSAGKNLALVVICLLLSKFSTPHLQIYLPGVWLVLFLQSLAVTVFILFLGLFISNLLSGANLMSRLVGFDTSSSSESLDREVRLFQNALDFSSVKIRNCIVPRTGIMALDQTASIDELLDKFVETGLSKILVYQDDIDNIIGYIHSSEMFNKPIDWTKKIHSLIFVPENMAANKLMKRMLEEKKNIAVVVDEFGGTSGVITLEDLVEEIFGEIEDEHDTKSYIAKQVREDEFILSGKAEIDTVNELFLLNIPNSAEYLTVAGYILNFHHHFPKINETICIDNYTFKIVKITNTKIELVRLKVNSK